VDLSRFGNQFSGALFSMSKIICVKEIDA